MPRQHRNRRLRRAGHLRHRRSADRLIMPAILVIEDSRGYAETLRSNLELEGYEVAVAHTGAEGLDRAKTGHFDLLILDLMLPSLNGFTVLQRLRDSGRQTPVLIMTALGTEDEKLRG